MPTEVTSEPYRDLTLECSNIDRPAGDSVGLNQLIQVNEIEGGLPGWRRYGRSMVAENQWTVGQL